MFLSFYALGSTRSTHLSPIEYLVTFLTHTFIEVIDSYWDVFKKSSWWNTVEKLTSLKS